MFNAEEVPVTETRNSRSECETNPLANAFWISLGEK